MIKPALKGVERIPDILDEKDMPGTSPACTRCSEPLPSSLFPNPHFSWSWPRGLPPHPDLHCREGDTLGQESRTLRPNSHFALLCCETSGKYLPLSGLARSSQRHSLILGVQVVSSCGHWNFLCAFCLAWDIVGALGMSTEMWLSGSLAMLGTK